MVRGWKTIQSSQRKCGDSVFGAGRCSKDMPGCATIEWFFFFGMKFNRIRSYTKVLGKDVLSGRQLAFCFITVFSPQLRWDDNLQECPFLDFQPLQSHIGKNATAVKGRSAPGSCAHSPKELVLMPDELAALLLRNVDGCPTWKPELSIWKDRCTIQQSTPGSTHRHSCANIQKSVKIQVSSDRSTPWTTTSSWSCRNCSRR